MQICCTAVLLLRHKINDIRRRCGTLSFSKIITQPFNRRSTLYSLQPRALDFFLDHMYQALLLSLVLPWSLHYIGFSRFCKNYTIFRIDHLLQRGALSRKSHEIGWTMTWLDINKHFFLKTSVPKLNV